MPRLSAMRFEGLPYALLCLGRKAGFLWTVVVAQPRAIFTEHVADEAQLVFVSVAEDAGQ